MSRVLLLGMAYLVACGGPKTTAPKGGALTGSIPRPLQGAPENPPTSRAWEDSATFRGSSLVIVRPWVWAESSTSPEEREKLGKGADGALADLRRFFGLGTWDPPPIIACKTEGCALDLAGPTRRSRVVALPKTHIVLAGLGPSAQGTLLHEMVHVEINRSMQERRPDLPTWVDEGVASFVGNNVRCPPGTPRAIDDLRRLDRPRAWEGFTNMAGRMDRTYCQARDEVAAWVGRHGREALLRVIEAVTSGKPFEEVYGPLVTAIPSEQYQTRLDAAFALDEDRGTDTRTPPIFTPER